MRWTPGDPNPDVDDERGSTGGGGGGGGGFRLGGAHMGIGGFVVLLLLSLIFKRNFFSMLGGGSSAPSAPAPVSGPRNATPANDRDRKFIDAMLGDIQNTWDQEFARDGQRYRHARLDLFTDRTRSACGAAEMEMGPFYCPADEKAYVDLGFFQELKDRFGAPGEFAQAYVLAHEIGHHVQKLLGISDKVTAAQEKNPSQANALSVRLELQADCFAGVWAHSLKQRSTANSPISIDESDVESALTAAAAVGDDRIQKQATGTVNPETWTHGSSKDRVKWFKTGMESGDINRCDTFGR